MIKRFIVSGIVVFFLSAIPASVIPQFTPEELAQRAKIEDILLKGEILHWKEVGIGVTKPLRMHVRLGDREISGIWKDPSAGDSDFHEGWRHEIAAYRLDDHLGVGMIPPTVERRFRMRKGSFQYWVEGLTTKRALNSEDREIPEDRQDACDRRQRLANAFDCLIANIDRTQENIAYTADWRVILLDHSRAFRTHNFYVDQLVYGDKGMSRKPIAPLPRNFVERLRGLDAKTIRTSVGKYLNPKEIQAVLKRRDLILDELDELIRKHGEDAVFYESPAGS
ncbi:MAG: hypothetical protein SCM96_12740 [Acidobacteriota bacterium]|nr:hypothetical protein [Acidobacteriota bacterium]